MKVSPQEYNSLLGRLIDPNEYTNFLRIPADEPIYEIDLNQRKINVPEFLSVEEDHNAEIIWFKTDRFYDNIDLYDSTCWIQYINANNEEYFYAAPIIIGAQEFGNEQILIPWAISKEVAKATGIISFSFQFFKLSEDKNRFLYVLNTQVAKSKILAGLRVDPMAFLTDGEKEETDVLPEREWLANEITKLYDAYSTLSGDYKLYWIDLL
jgi:hypothetical protein